MSRPEPRTRPAVPSDANAIGQLVYLSASTYSEWYPGWKPRMSAEDSARASSKHLLNNHCWTKVALDEDDEIIGVLSYGPSSHRLNDIHDLSISYLDMLFVAPDYWSRGIASYLMTSAKKAMQEEGYKGSYLWAVAGNTRARTFYERREWTTDGSSYYHPRHKLELIRYDLLLESTPLE